ncbi:ATP-binding protein [Streptomyces sp. NPDC093071]|uniref:ATP-binding protein n=1 Tax=Streptomyces sp. NPDC093071 TaxID=3366022 RepID=UPI0038307C26
MTRHNAVVSAAGRAGPPRTEEAEASEVTRQSTIPRSSPPNQQRETAGPHSPGIVPEETSALEVAFLPAPERISDMRRATMGFLVGVDAPEQTSDNVVLVVSELVTNAIRHACGEVSLRLSTGAGYVKVVVLAESRDRAVVTDAGPDDEAGRGMLLVDAVADSWGCSAGETWCVFRYGPEPAGTVAA